MNDLEKICADAYEARVKIGTLDTDIKNKVLNDAADNLLKAEKEILEAKQKGYIIRGFRAIKCPFTG